MNDIDADVLDILACPACLGKFAWDYEALELLCVQCGRAYPVRGGIPRLKLSDARQTTATDDTRV